MPSGYVYADDGLIHTRYSDLIRCTPGSVYRVVEEFINPDTKFSTDTMVHGDERHRIFQSEILETGKMPACFNEDLQLDDAETELKCEIFPGVILHSTVDGYKKEEYLIDFKTTIDPKKKANKRQLYTYAINLGQNGVMVPRGAFMYEVWDRDRQTVLERRSDWFDITPADIGDTWEWLTDRADCLYKALDAYGVLPPNVNKDD